MKKIKVGSLKELDNFNQFTKWIDDHDILVFKHQEKIRAFQYLSSFWGP